LDINPPGTNLLEESNFFGDGTTFVSSFECHRSVNDVGGGRPAAAKEGSQGLSRWGLEKIKRERGREEGRTRNKT
jgi:hypothetical protein